MPTSLVYHKSTGENHAMTRIGPGSKPTGEGCSRLVCSLVLAVNAVGDKGGSIPYQNFHHDGLFGAFI
jgi:hypothetical protein